MLKSSTPFGFAPAALLLAALFLPPSAAGSTALIDGSGGVVSIQAGAFGELFPGEKDCAPLHTVLALSRLEDDGDLRQLLVPGTCGPEVELHPALALDEASGSVFVLWQSKRASGSSRILASYLVDETWSEILEVNEQAQVLRAGPRLVTTQDEITFKASDGTVGKAVRRILHVVWAEGSSAAAPRTYYAPIILVDGELIGNLPIFDLQELPTGAGEGSTSATGAPLDLARPELIAGLDERSVIVGYYHPELRSVVALEVRQLPAVLTMIAADAADFALEAGASALNRPGGIEELARLVGERIFETGTGLHASVRTYLSLEVQRAILEESLEADGPGIPIDTLAGTIGSRVIEYGSRVFGTDGLERVYEDDRLSLVSITPSGFGGAETVAPQHLLRFYAVSNRSTPDLEGRTATFLASRSGENGLLCWQEGASEVRYQESTAEGWGPVRAFPLSAGFGYEQIQEILRERVRER